MSFNFHKLCDGFGQDVINKSYEKAWKKGKIKPTLVDLNDDWCKAAGKHNKYKRLPKYDAKRGLKNKYDDCFERTFK